MLRSAVPSRKSAWDTASQLVSLVLGSDEEVAVANLGLDGLTDVVLDTFVVVVVVVFAADAGFSVGFVDGSAVGPSAAGPPSPGTSGPPIPRLSEHRVRYESGRRCS